MLCSLSYFLPCHAYVSIIKLLCYCVLLCCINMWFMHVIRHFQLLIGWKSWEPFSQHISNFWCLGPQSEPNTHDIQKCLPGTGPYILQDLKLCIHVYVYLCIYIGYTYCWTDVWVWPDHGQDPTMGTGSTRLWAWAAPDHGYGLRGCSYLNRHHGYWEVLLPLSVTGLPYYGTEPKGQWAMSRQKANPCQKTGWTARPSINSQPCRSHWFPAPLSASKHGKWLKQYCLIWQTVAWKIFLAYPWQIFCVRHWKYMEIGTNLHVWRQ